MTNGKGTCFENVVKTFFLFDKSNDGIKSTSQQTFFNFNKNLKI